VLQAREATGGGAFLLFLGDHVYLPPPGGPSPAAAVLDAWSAADAPAAVVGMHRVGAAELPRVGVARGEPAGADVPRGPAAPGLYRCADFVEKPDAATAERRLRTPGLPAGAYLAHGGIYAFAGEMFERLADLAASGSAGGEIELAAAQRQLLEDRPEGYYLLELPGRAFDTGSVTGYAEAFEAFAADQTQPRAR
jgi:UTP-glucose-1-phosphate uridylyltransferase